MVTGTSRLDETAFEPSLAGLSLPGVGWERPAGPTAGLAWADPATLRMLLRRATRRRDGLAVLARDLDEVAEGLAEGARRVPSRVPDWHSLSAGAYAEAATRLCDRAGRVSVALSQTGGLVRAEIRALDAECLRIRAELEARVARAWAGAP
ncbi:MAG TPA: hypothetical protein VFQ96_00245 [Microbacteriaceae bacterium]|nr:hypothetical protein [Microbacteriaceae bacterium]